MLKKTANLLMMVSLFVVMATVAGCGGGQALQRIAGLTPENVVRTFFDAAKNNRINEAALYVSDASKNDPQTVLKFVTGQTDVQQLKDANLVLVKQVAVQGDYAAVAVTVEKSGSFQLKAVGLERVAGEWYIVDFNQILNNAKYDILRNLLSSIK